MRFPEIHNINDVMPFVNENFSVVEKLGVTVIDYHSIAGDTFKPLATADSQEEYDKRVMQREFRGLTFCQKSGDLLRRPYHKFKNVGEDIDSMPAEIEKIKAANDNLMRMSLKLDGSMIAPLLIDGEIFWGTRMLSEEHHDMVAAVVTDYEKDFVYNAIRRKYTPIFEFCSRQNRVVIDYPEPKLTLTNLRTHYEGLYRFEDVYTFSEYPSINVEAPRYFSGHTIEETVEFVRPVADIEGYVLQFDSGEIFKIKTEVYCSLHKVVSNLIQERHIAKHVIDDTIDDLLPFFTGEDHDNITRFVQNFQQEVLRPMTERVYYMLDEVRDNGWSKKEYALQVGNTNPACKSIIFRHMEDYKTGQHCIDTIAKDIRIWLENQTRSQTIYEKFKRDFNIKVEWSWR